MDKSLLLGFALIAIVCFLLGMLATCILYERTSSDLYKQGQIDALNGKWKYSKVMSTEPVYVKIQNNEVVK